MYHREIVVTYEDGSEDVFFSVMRAVAALNISATTIYTKMKSGEPYLWRGERIKFRYKENNNPQNAMKP